MGAGKGSTGEDLRSDWDSTNMTSRQTSFEFTLSNASGHDLHNECGTAQRREGSVFHDEGIRLLRARLYHYESVRF